MTKGQTLDLNKESNKTLTKVRIGAGWDVAEGQSVDLDLWLIPKTGDPVYFNNKKIPGAELDGDDRTGAGSEDGADENIAIDISALQHDEYTVMINIFDAVKKGQFFKDVKRAFVEVEDADEKKLIATYDISENGGDNFSLIAGKIEKKDGGLHFTSMSEFSTKAADVITSEVQKT